MSRIIVLFTGVIGIFALSAVVWGVPDDAAKPDPQADASYVGVKTCRKCHMRQYRTWKKMKHAKAWSALPAKYQALDQKDEKGRACVSCHVTGYGDADRGGFADPTKSEKLLNVQCEACHGPGSKHVEAGKKLQAEKRKHYNPGEEHFITKKTAACANCHNPHVKHSKYKAAE